MQTKVDENFLETSVPVEKFYSISFLKEYLRSAELWKCCLPWNCFTSQ